MQGLKVCFITIICTLIYLIASVGINNLFFYKKSNGSLITIDSRIIGSKLIGQKFNKNIFFENRPSLNNYKNDVSGNSNLPYYSTELRRITQERFKEQKNKNSEKPPLNLITESASGLDPHITYESAIFQVSRINKETKISKAQLIDLINQHSKKKILGLLGEKIVNVLELNLEVSKLYATKKS